jgi:hypothetical protein
MSGFAVRNDGQGWRAVSAPNQCGADESWQADQPAAPKPPSARITQIKAALLEIDLKKIRAITDAELTGDKTRLQTLETQAAALRTELATL